MGEATFKTRVDLDEEWRSMQQRLIELIQGDAKSDFGDEVLLLDPSVYTDPNRFDAERQKIFKEQPMLVGLSSELSEPGDRVLFDEAGLPILVIRGEDGVLRAFLNTCTHRGARLVSNTNRTGRLLCPFHGWAFDLEGRVAGVPLARGFEGLDLDTRCLVRVPVSEWKGLVFVRARRGDDELDIEQFLGPIAPLLEALELDTLRRVSSDRLEVQSNWKLALDMGRENYHVPVVHKDSLALNLYPQVTIFDCYGPHSRFSGATRDFAELALESRSESEWPPMKYQAVHYLFPNTTLSFTHAVDGKTPVVTMSRVFPGETIGETVTLMATYKRGGADEPPDEELEAMHTAVVEIVGTEDYGVAREVWRNIERNAPGFSFVLGRNELLVQKYHQEIAERIGMPLPS